MGKAVFKVADGSSEGNVDTLPRSTVGVAANVLWFAVAMGMNVFSTT